MLTQKSRNILRLHNQKTHTTRINPKIIKNKFLTKQLIKFNQILELPSNQNKELGLQFLRTQFI